MIKLLNKIGMFIEWKYFNKVECHIPALYPDVHYKYRYSKVLDRWQHVDVHCMGLNPPEYLLNWYNIPLARKPKMRQIEGVWCVSVIEEIQKGTAYPPSYNKPITMKKEQA